MQKILALVFFMLVMQITMAPAQKIIAPESISSMNQILQEISTKEPRSSGEWNDEGAVLIGSGSYIESLDYFNKSIESDANDPTVWINKGVSLAFLGRYEESLECFDKAIKLDASDPTAWFNKGLTLFCPG